MVSCPCKDEVNVERHPYHVFSLGMIHVDSCENKSNENVIYSYVDDFIVGARFSVRSLWITPLVVLAIVSDLYNGMSGKVSIILSISSLWIEISVFIFVGLHFLPQLFLPWLYLLLSLLLIKTIIQIIHLQSFLANATTIRNTHLPMFIFFFNHLSEFIIFFIHLYDFIFFFNHLKQREKVEEEEE